MTACFCESEKAIARKRVVEASACVGVLDARSASRANIVLLQQHDHILLPIFHYGNVVLEIRADDEASSIEVERWG